MQWVKNYLLHLFALNQQCKFNEPQVTASKNSHRNLQQYKRFARRFLWLVLLNLYWGNTDFPTTGESNNKICLLCRHYCNHIKFANNVRTFTSTFSQILPIKLSSKFIYCMLCSVKHNLYYLREQTQTPGNWNWEWPMILTFNQHEHTRLFCFAGFCTL